jgi:fluoride exporter
MLSSAAVWLAVAGCGGLGAVARLLVDGAVSRRVSSRLPVGTLVVNLSGCFLLGLLDGWLLPPDVALVVGTGVVGSYTTFSTWMFETQRLGEERQLSPALWNLGTSVVAGTLVAALGLWLGGHL